MDIESRIAVKTNNGDIVSADILLYKDDGDIVKKISIIESETLAALQKTIDGYESTYISRKQLDTILLNENKSETIDATLFNGRQSSDYVLKSNIPNDFVPINHSESSGRYGLANKTNYGHTKVRDDLKATVFTDGEALAARQGKIIDDKITIANNEITKLKTEANYSKIHLLIGRIRNGSFEQEYASRIQTTSGDKIYIRAFADGIDMTGKSVALVINGETFVYYLDSQGYTLNTNNERSGKVINWSSNYNGLVYAFMSGDENNNILPSFAIKRLEHMV